MKARIIKHYLKTVESLIPDTYQQKKQLLAGLEFNVNSYAIKHKNADENDLYDVFGTPESIAEQCGYIKTSCVDGARKSKAPKHIITILLLMLILFVMLVGTGVFGDFLNAFINRL